MNPGSSRIDKKETLATAFRNEFKCEHFSLNFETNSSFQQKDPERVLRYFHSPIWPCCRPIIYLIYRIAVAIYYTLWFVESIITNYEYRVNNVYITNKNKVNILLIHPWYVYMTSWSLAILFIHLWLSAFICLYFYSIDQKSRLSDLFTLLFGPFSCSRGQSIQHHSESSPSFLKKLKQTFIKSSSIPASRDVEIPVSSNSPTQSSELVSLSSTSHQTQPVPTIRTYCDNQAKCNMPSRLVGSDAVRWNLWIHTHVPKVILVSIKISWMLYNNIVISAIIVTTVYFTFFTLSGYEIEPTGWMAEIGNYHRHGFNSLVAIIDLVILAYPVRILHFVYTVAYGWVYAFVTFIYWLQNKKTNIVYEQIDYAQPFMVLGYYLILSALTFVMQIIHFLVYRLKLAIRDFLRDKCASNTTDSNL